MMSAQQPAVLIALCVSCQAPDPVPMQGVVEFDERTLAFELPGHLSELTVAEGDVVIEAAPVAKLDDTLETLTKERAEADSRYAQATLDLLRAGARPREVAIVRADLHSAREELALARREQERADALAIGGSIPLADQDRATTAATAAFERVRHLEQQLGLVRDGARPEELEGAEARLDASRAQVKHAVAMLERHTLLSPLAGQVVETHADVGEFVGAGAPVVTVADIGHPYVDVFVPEATVGEARVGRSAVVRVDSSDARLDGEIEHIGRRTEYTPRYLFSPDERVNLVIRVRVGIDDPQHRLRAGTPAFVSWASEVD